MFCPNCGATLPDGTKFSYQGDFDEHKLPHGRGLAIFNDTSRYDGPFVHGHMDGDSAVYTLDDGSVFRGTMHADTMYNGRIEYPDGQTFDGSFVGNKPARGKYNAKK